MDRNENKKQETEIIEEKQVLMSEKKKNSYFSENGWFGIFAIFGVAFLIFFYVFQVFMVPIKIVGSSMQPTINTKIVSETDTDHSDIVYYHKQKKYSNDDIVIISNPNKKYVEQGNVESIIKRVIACPGQTLIFTATIDRENSTLDNKVYYYDVSVKDKNGNNVDLDDSYLSSTNRMKFTEKDYRDLLDKSQVSTSPVFPFLQNIYLSLMNEYTETPHTYSLTLGKNEYFVLGDNRNGSEDSRYFGTIDLEDISGKVLLQVEYGENLWSAIWNKITNK